jgi:hypothetical protein
MKNETSGMEGQLSIIRKMKWIFTFFSLAAIISARAINGIVSNTPVSFGIGFAVVLFLTLITIISIGISRFAASQIRYGTWDEYSDKTNVQYIDILTTFLVCVTLIVLVAAMPFGDVVSLANSEEQAGPFTGGKLHMSTHIMRASVVLFLFLVCFLQWSELNLARKYPESQAPRSLPIRRVQVNAEQGKSGFEPIQSFPVVFLLCVFFGISPILPGYLQKEVGPGVAIMYLLILSVVSLAVITICAKWMRHRKDTDKRGYMAALFFGSILGMLAGVIGLIGIHGSELGAWLFSVIAGVASPILITIMLIAYMSQIMLDRRMRDMRNP